MRSLIDVSSARIEVAVSESSTNVLIKIESTGKGIQMKRMIAGGIVALALSTSAAHAQDMFMYEFEIEVVSNEVADNISEGDLASLEVGTVGVLKFVLENEPGDYPDWNGDYSTVFNIHEIMLNIGTLSAQQRSGSYPTTTAVRAMQLSNDGWSDYPDRIRMDFLGGIFALDHPEIALCTLQISERSLPNEFPLLFDSLNLPTSANLNLATTRRFLITTVVAGVELRVDFEIIALEGSVIPGCRVDVNRDGTVSAADFTAWMDAYNNSLPGCDQNGDSACSPADFTAWIANYNAGC